MPEYVYGCRDKEHKERVTVAHARFEDPFVPCSECGQAMHRVPQKFRWYHNPGEVLLDHMDNKYRDWRVKQQQKKRAKTRLQTKPKGR